MLKDFFRERWRFLSKIANFLIIAVIGGVVGNSAYVYLSTQVAPIISTKFPELYRNYKKIFDMGKMLSLSEAFFLCVFLFILFIIYDYFTRKERLVFSALASAYSKLLNLLIYYECAASKEEAVEKIGIAYLETIINVFPYVCKATIWIQKEDEPNYLCLIASIGVNYEEKEYQPIDIRTNNNDLQYLPFACNAFIEGKIIQAKIESEQNEHGEKVWYAATTNNKFSILDNNESPICKEAIAIPVKTINKKISPPQKQSIAVFCFASKQRNKFYNSKNIDNLNDIVNKFATVLTRS